MEISGKARAISVAMELHLGGEEQVFENFLLIV